MGLFGKKDALLFLTAGVAYIDSILFNLMKTSRLITKLLAAMMPYADCNSFNHKQRTLYS